MTQQQGQHRRQQKLLHEEVTTDLSTKLDSFKPLIGRDREMAQLLEILNRKEKSNPVLIGEPGVGKTAIVEGLVQRIDTGDVPQKLQDAKVLELDIGRVEQLGQQFGSMEVVAVNLVKSLKAAEERDGHANNYLFIDEFHRLMTTGRSAQMSFIDALKPAMARGDIKVIGATTRLEYKKIEEDKAFERRVTPVYVDEPSFEDTVEILQGVRLVYEDFHEVKYDDDVIPFVIKASQQYIKDRFLPDKAIDLLDIVGSKRNLTYPGFNTEEFDEEIERIKAEYVPLVSQGDYINAYPLREQMLQLESDKRQYIDEAHESRFTQITKRDVKDILTEYFGVEVEIDLTKEEEIETLNNIESNIKQHLIGQDEAVEKVVKKVVAQKLGLRLPNKPVGSFLFYGPSGVGKTELAKQLAKELFGDEERMLRLNMGEYQERHTVSKLLGSPMGYLGYGSGNTAFEPLRRNPSQVVLVDELEKAHPHIQNVFLSILDDGHIVDQENNHISFTETVLIFTTNAEPSHLTDAPTVGFGGSGRRQEGVVAQFDAFRPEFINRFDAVVEFKPMTSEMLGHIFDIRIQDMNDRYDDLGYIVEFTNPAKDVIVNSSIDPKMGARPMIHKLEDLVEGNMQERLLSGDMNPHFKFVVRDGEVVLEESTVDTITPIITTTLENDNTLNA